MTGTFDYKLKDLNGKLVPDSRVTPVLRDALRATGDYDLDAKNNVMAYCFDGMRVSLSGVGRDSVKFVAGLWRVQDLHQQYNVVCVRDKKFILGEKINHHEKNLFDYYRAAIFAENCYGTTQPMYSYVVAKYDTANGAMWSYGLTIEQARAFLGIALFDKHIDMIHKAERQNKI